MGKDGTFQMVLSLPSEIVRDVMRLQCSPIVRIYSLHSHHFQLCVTLSALISRRQLYQQHVVWDLKYIEITIEHRRNSWRIFQFWLK